MFFLLDGLGRRMLRSKPTGNDLLVTQRHHSYKRHARGKVLRKRAPRPKGILTQRRGDAEAQRSYFKPQISQMNADGGNANHELTRIHTNGERCGNLGIMNFISALFFAFPVFWRCDAVGQQTHSYGEAQTCRRTESNKVNQTDKNGHRRHRKEKAEHLQTRATGEIAVKKKTNEYRESDPAKTRNH